MAQGPTLDQLTGLAAAPVLVALTEVVKKAWPTLPSRFWPIVSIVWGVAWCVALAVRSGEAVLDAVLWGILSGLVATGLFSATRALGAPSPKQEK